MIDGWGFLTRVGGHFFGMNVDPNKELWKLEWVHTKVIDWSSTEYRYEVCLRETRLASYYVTSNNVMFGLNTIAGIVQLFLLNSSSWNPFPKTSVLSWTVIDATHDWTTKRSNKDTGTGLLLWDVWVATLKFLVNWTNHIPSLDVGSLP